LKKCFKLAILKDILIARVAELVDASRFIGIACPISSLISF